MKNNFLKISFNTKIRSNFAKVFNMLKQKKILFMEVTDEEEDLIVAIRNYCKSYPNGYPELLWYAQRLFETMTDMPKD